jgi:cathepsin O
MKYIAFITLFLTINSLVNENIFQNQFSDFKLTYNKSYATKEEEKKRFTVFKKNFEKYGYVHELSDLPDHEQSLEEFKRTNQLPEYFTTYSDILGDAKDQKNCGFCYAFSFISQIEAQFFIKYGKSYRFSEQELLDCSNGIITCNGGRPEKMEKFFLNRNYLALEDKYESYSGISNPSNCELISLDEDKYSSTIKFKVEDVKYIFRFRNVVHCIKSQLIKHGPLGAVINSDAFKNYHGGIIDSSENCDGSVNHAVTIVGYDTYYDKNTKKYETYWIIRNSYGLNFGEMGYAKIKVGQNICGIEKEG